MTLHCPLLLSIWGEELQNMCKISENNEQETDTLLKYNIQVLIIIKSTLKILIIEMYTLIK